MRRITLAVLLLVLLQAAVLSGCGKNTVAKGSRGKTSAENPGTRTYVVVGTGQTACYDNTGEIPAPQRGRPFFGQDAQHGVNEPSYADNGDGTITDRNTGLVWVKARGSKVSWDSAVAGASTCRAGGFNDWRVPTIKELYSLINFTGKCGTSTDNSRPYLDTRYFEFAYGDTSAGERLIDCQDWSATRYVGTTMRGDATVFGVNFADGRIKGYPRVKPGPSGGAPNTLYIRYVRGNPKYGANQYRDNGDGTVTDAATGLMWAKEDSGAGMNWQAALEWVQGKNDSSYLGHNDWRLPNAKELQSIVDYTRAPGVTGSAAIDPVFKCTPITDEGGGADFACYWSSTTHLDEGPVTGGHSAVYVAFGNALGWMEMPPGSGNRTLLDVHGAGAQRSDPKAGNPNEFPHGRGPQGDVIRIDNYVRCVRDAT